MPLGREGGVAVLFDDAPFGDRVADVLSARLDEVAVEVVTDRDGVLDRLADGVDCLVAATGPPDAGTRSFVAAVREAEPSIPIVFVTADASQAAVRETIEAGADDHLSAPDGDAGAVLLARRVRAAVEAQRSRRLLSQRNRRLETLISNLPGVVYRCRNEPGWPMEFVRGECAALTGYDARAVEAGEVSWGEDVIHPEDREWVWDAVQGALDDREPFEVTYRVRTREGQIRHVWERGRGLYDDGDLQALEGFITDVTDRQARKETLQRERNRLEEFVDVVSHDLRNPLNVAQARLELARDDPSPEHLDAVGRSLDRMEDLIADLLTVAREGRDVDETGPVALDEAVERCWDQVATDDATLENEASSALEADESRLRQVLENLFRNSVEHGPPDGGAGAEGADGGGGADPQRPPADAGSGSDSEAESTLTRGDHGAAESTVTVRVGETEDGFYVADDGTGVPETDRDRVFEAGYTTADDGTGFGLNIVKEVAEAHGWTVRLVESASGGARFEFDGVAFLDGEDP